MISSDDCYFSRTNFGLRTRHVNLYKRGPSRRGFAIILLSITLCALVAHWPSQDPTYQGKTLSQWLDQLDSAREQRMQYHSAPQLSSANAEAEQPFRQSEAEAEHAIQQMGTNALPRLIRMIQVHDSFLKRSLM